MPSVSACTYLPQIAVALEPFVARRASEGPPVISLVHVLFCLGSRVEAVPASFAGVRFLPMVFVVHMHLSTLPFIPGVVAAFAFVYVPDSVGVLVSRLPRIELAITDSTFWIHSRSCLGTRHVGLKKMEKGSRAI